jgi:hypothetical protein
MSKLIFMVIFNVVFMVILWSFSWSFSYFSWSLSFAYVVAHDQSHGHGNCRACHCHGRHPNDHCYIRGHLVMVTAGHVVAIVEPMINDTVMVIVTILVMVILTAGYAIAVVVRMITCLLSWSWSQS